MSVREYTCKCGTTFPAAWLDNADPQFPPRCLECGRCLAYPGASVARLEAELAAERARGEALREAARETVCTLEFGAECCRMTGQTNAEEALLLAAGRLRALAATAAPPPDAGAEGDDEG